MTGRELIVYILENKLEDSEVFKDGGFLNFIDVDTAAAKYEVGRNTVLAWIQIGSLPAVKFGDNYYIYPDGQNVLNHIMKTKEATDKAWSAFVKCHPASRINF